MSYYDRNKEKFKLNYGNNLINRTIYLEKNKDKIRQQKQEYYIKRCKKYCCIECKKCIIILNYEKHVSSKKHIENAYNNNVQYRSVVATYI